jgi:predicted outer membrane repeat protein
MPDNVDLYGGFAGSETLLSQRDWTANETVLSGDIATAGVNTDNSYHVVVGADDAILDGFSVERGFDESGIGGGGMLLHAVSSARVAHVTFDSNRTLDGGGAVAILNSASVDFTSVIFSGNTAANGGAVYGYAKTGDAQSIGYIDCIFDGNVAGSNGGVLHSDTVSVGPSQGQGSIGSTYTNCTFHGNTASQGGVAWITGSTIGGGGGSVTFRNSTLTNNTGEGNAVYVASRGNVNVVNSILWNEGAGDEFREGEGNFSFANSIVYGGIGAVSPMDWGGVTDNGGNLSADPQFVNAADPDGADDTWLTADDGLRLAISSPGINTGDAALLPADTADLDGDGNVAEAVPYDIAEATRVRKGHLDMGAYESANAVWRVDADAAGLDNGVDWANAFVDLQSALGHAHLAAGDQVWVAEGLYKPGALVSSSFAVQDGVALYGGFAGTELELAARDWTVHETVLSGDVGTLGDPTDNCLRVVVAGDGARVDGVTITGGYNGSTGAGLYSVAGDLTVAHCTFHGNRAMNGAALYHAGADAVVDGCLFLRNEATGEGGALAAMTFDSLVLQNSLFLCNRADSDGGAAYLRIAPVTVRNNLFLFNEAGGRGGALFHTANGANPHLVVNNIIGNNQAASAADGHQAYASGGAFVEYATNNIQDGVPATVTDGGGHTEVDPLFVQAPDAPATAWSGVVAVYDPATDTTLVTSPTLSLGAGAHAGRFLAPSAANMARQFRIVANTSGSVVVRGHLEPAAVGEDYRIADYHLREESPCVDGGETARASAWAYDGTARPQGAAADVGPYERARPGAPVTQGWGYVPFGFEDAAPGTGLPGDAVQTPGVQDPAGDERLADVLPGESGAALPELGAEGGVDELNDLLGGGQTTLENIQETFQAAAGLYLAEGGASESLGGALQALQESIRTMEEANREVSVALAGIELDAPGFAERGDVLVFGYVREVGLRRAAVREASGRLLAAIQRRSELGARSDRILADEITAAVEELEEETLRLAVSADVLEAVRAALAEGQVEGSRARMRAEIHRLAEAARQAARESLLQARARRDRLQVDLSIASLRQASEENQPAASPPTPTEP